MDPQLTEEQQYEQLKSIVKEYGVPVLLGAVIGLGGLIGWRTFSSHQLETQGKASEQYAQLIDELVKETPDVQGKADQLIQSHPDSTYAVLAEFHAAKALVDKKEYAKAKEKLIKAFETADSPEIKSIANVRLVKILIALEKYDEALKQLKQPHPKSFNAQFEELKGDIFVAKGELTKARDAYQKALDEDGAKSSPALQLKFDDLAVIAKQ
ncbi:YfgM family protein [Algicola sagamiensis]|uniref:YfgM family protein n=1 Tax=Algicola sagamiensis TaxID=163869 RepID=UPI00035F57B9|nr:tetratricopeptide repeat protein [Algicola sagamiensis]